MIILALQTSAPGSTRRCSDAESTSLTLIQRRNNVVYPVSGTAVMGFVSECRHPGVYAPPSREPAPLVFTYGAKPEISEYHGRQRAAAKYWTNVILMLSQRRRRWANIKTTLLQYILFDRRRPARNCWDPLQEISATAHVFIQCWANVGPTSTTSPQRCSNTG